MNLLKQLKTFLQRPKYSYYRISYKLFYNELFNHKTKKIHHLNRNNFYMYKYVLFTYLDFYFLLETTQTVYKTAFAKPTKFLLKLYIPVAFYKITFYANYFSKILTKNIKIHLYTLFVSFRWIWLSFIIAILYFFFSLFFIQIDLTKQLTLWYILLILYYLILSGFNTFLNKYRYGKFTSAIQRFWKRTGIIFWLIEGFLFLLFFYYFLNSSQEPLYMFDYSNLNQELLISLKITYKNLLLLSIAIWLSFLLLININFFLYYQNILTLLSISGIVTYTLYLESYQFVYIVSAFSDKEWIFDELQNTWILEVEQNNFRVKQQYFILCLVAKYWHFIFIFISWFFFLIKSLETNSVSITMLGYNTQNLLILYLLNLLCLTQWLKILTKKFLEITYSWFFTQYDDKFTITLLHELWTVIFNYLSLNDTKFLNINANSLMRVYSITEIPLWKM